MYLTAILGTVTLTSVVCLRYAAADSQARPLLLGLKSQHLLLYHPVTVRLLQFFHDY